MTRSDLERAERTACAVYRAAQETGDKDRIARAQKAWVTCVKVLRMAS